MAGRISGKSNLPDQGDDQSRGEADRDNGDDNKKRFLWLDREWEDEALSEESGSEGNTGQ